ncbi:UNVERIFIED_CONTAM: membrane protein [Mumia flava]
MVLGCLAFTPSLLPRPALFQGLVAGVSTAIGYGLGVLVAFVWRELVDREARVPEARWWRVYGTVATVLVVASVVLGRRWQDELRGMMGMAREPWPWLLTIPLVWALVAVLGVLLGRGIRAAYRWLVTLLDRGLGERASKVLGLAIVVALLVMAVDGVLFDRLRAGANEIFSVRNGLTPPGVERPVTARRSGGPDSYVAWSDLGREGRVFVAGGPDAARITEFTRRPALEPVRVFAGMESAGEIDDRAALAVRDLQRAGGFARSNLLVVTTTGSGWVEEGSASAFEYLSGGDSAIVGIQYSYFPSWISYLADQELAQEAGRALFDAVYAHWLEMPSDARPRLWVSGESLGSFGAEAAFSGAHDLANRTDGTLLVGPPSFNRLYRRFVDDRDAGTTEIDPVYSEGEVVRFTRRPAEPVPPVWSDWDGTRVLYLQHPSDPIVWWSTDLIFSRPDWLSEPRGPDVLDTVRWIPLVTFWQVSADLAIGAEVPAGYGHNYTGEHVDGWADVLRSPGWTPERSARLRAMIAEDEGR